jgi:hypothetical protein
MLTVYVEFFPESDDINHLDTDSKNLLLINGHFTNISSHFFTNYKKLYDVQTIILRCLVISLILIGSKLMTQNANISFLNVFFICVIAFESFKDLKKTVRISVL